MGAAASRSVRWRVGVAHISSAARAAHRELRSLLRLFQDNQVCEIARDRSGARHNIAAY